jgi:hypothetical protein
MELPVRIDAGPFTEPVISVDGSFDAPGLNLSHWPGNRTPAELRHDLSTGSALLFAALPAERRRALAQGATAIVNNHYDTDGTCALFAVRHPGLALEHRAALLEAAAAGDFFHTPSERAVIVDLVVEAMAEPERSPLRLGGLEPAACHQRATEHLLLVLPRLLAGDVAPYRPLFEEGLAALRSDQARLAGAARDDVVHLDWTIWTAPRGAEPFDPGRHALFGTSGRDRVLAIGPGRAGTTYRFLLSTLSWFELVTRTAQPRPALALLAQRLNELEGSAPEDECAWRAQDDTGPTPELWFGVRELERFSERCPALRPSRLAPVQVRHACAEALRASLVLPESR